ncbi:MAG: biopolymer transporter ExbD [Candidatus Aminicenantes bacterium]|jgi:biopolymer transport protein TolR|nr:biopolymer transporter ExbD [Candidatus Aminicenantes bacterium]MDH5383335.1 biopolymer transporter ExbD [Candidatus Aminicenantes bacterium]MDH5742876.1 biopolymer transporter ExbD [Candidatus Aminicenantes bacterium]
MAFKFRSISKREIGTSLSEINVTPLVDVMLVLLVIFMVTAPMLKMGIGVNLPQAETQSAPAEEGLTLTVTPDRYIHMEGQPVNIFLLETRLRQYFFRKEKKVIFIQADKDLNYGYVIQIMDIAKKVGVEVIGLLTEPPEKQKRR